MIVLCVRAMTERPVLLKAVGERQRGRCRKRGKGVRSGSGFLAMEKISDLVLNVMVIWWKIESREVKGSDSHFTRTILVIV